MKQSVFIIKDEKGIALITAIMLLVILTIIGLAAVNTMQMERDIASGETAYRIGFYHADSGVSYARTSIKESHIKNKTMPVSFGVPTGSTFKLTIVKAWQDTTNDWRYVIESETDPEYDKLAGVVTIQAEIKLATVSNGAEEDLGLRQTYN